MYCIELYHCIFLHNASRSITPYPTISPHERGLRPDSRTLLTKEISWVLLLNNELLFVHQLTLFKKRRMDLNLGGLREYPRLYKLKGVHKLSNMCPFASVMLISRLLKSNASRSRKYTSTGLGRTVLPWRTKLHQILFMKGNKSDDLQLYLTSNLEECLLDHPLKLFSALQL